ncbi:MAG: ankyrin repeat domain-containing protein, partial [Planctomycetota bacterium]|nr:ankyrin repeat domain-containing protein [Planctomycetota bacterium]
MACGSNLNPEVIKLLAANGGSLKATRRGGISPLMFAAMSNTPEIAEVLIELGSEADHRTQKGMSAYLYAALSGRYPGMFQLLVANGADPNATQDGTNAIEMSAAINENSGIMAAILGAGTRIPPLTRDGGSVLSWASGNSNPSVAEALLAAGVDPNPREAEPPLLSFASVGVNPEVIQTLLDAGADVNGRSRKVIPGMLQFKPFYLPGTTPLMLACDNISISAADIVPFVSVLLAGGADVNAANRGGYTPMMFAANKRYKTGSTAEVVRLRMEAGADPSVRNQAGLTARDIAEANPKLTGVDLDAVFGPRTADPEPADDR